MGKHLPIFLGVAAAAAALGCSGAGGARGHGGGTTLMTPEPFVSTPRPARVATATATPAAPTELEGATMRVHFIDVGQGDAALLEFSCGVVLVDTGGEQDDEFDSVAAIVSWLDRFFEGRPDLDRTIALLVVSHMHIDHVRGVPAVLSKFRVRNVVFNGHSGEALVRESHEALDGFVRAHPAAHRAVAVADLPARAPRTDAVIDPLACGDVDPRLAVLWGGASPDVGWPSDVLKNDNNHSVVLRVDFGKASALFTGDLEETALATLVERYAGTAALDVDLYKVGHHGSRNGTTRALVEAMTPEVAVMGMSPASRHADWSAWKYGHPRKPAVDLLLAGLSGRRVPGDFPVATAMKTFADTHVEAALYGTGWDGEVTVTASAAGKLAVSTGAAVATR